MRGTHVFGSISDNRAGIIPAYAGNTYVVAGCASQVEDHPRVCGEHIYTTNPDLLDPGSSPRMRGTLADDGEPCFTPGIIPAYAGNTGSRSTMPPTFWDHPRVCGEHIPHDVNHGASKGSSPRMRGTQMKLDFNSKDGGIIPAYAGNTSMLYFAHKSQQDHPRVCGEHTAQT